jgi:poly-gamma-glutamate capsule biosynthesis protein CapA/YwtB (metallophosphatase superfamily)
LIVRLLNKHILSSFVLVFLTIQASSQEYPQLKLLFTGDIMGHDTQIESAKKQGEGTYDYTSCFMHLEPFISSADIAIGNLEVTLAGPPYKGYPAFSSPDELALELKNVGFDLMVHANNHAIDRRKKGLERTLTILDSIDMIHSGVFKDAEERSIHYPLIVEKNDIRLALLNYTYGTNGIKVTAPNIVNYIDTIQIKMDLLKAATAEPDFVIVLMHWGLEYQRTENKAQQDMAQFLFENGADAIIGSHPHVVQPIKMYGEKNLVVYSMGNMISNQRKRYTDGGIMVEVTLEKSDSTYVSDYSYLPIWVYKPQTKLGTAFQLVPAAIDSAMQVELEMDSESIKSMTRFLKDTRDNLAGNPEMDWGFSE